MAQRSIENYFNIRKRPAKDELISNKIKRGKNETFKNQEVTETSKSGVGDPAEKSCTKNIEVNLTGKRTLRSRAASNVDGATSSENNNVSDLKDKLLTTGDNQVNSAKEMTKNDKKVVTDSQEKSLEVVKRKVVRSSRLDKLKESIARFQESDNQLQNLETKTKSKKLLLPDTTSVVDNSKSVVEEPQDTSASKQPAALTKSDLHALSSSSINIPDNNESLSLPRKYRYLVEVFRAIDTVSQILYNRQEIIIFKKVKSGVEQMLKRNITEKHLGQIKCLYPDAYLFHYEKLREYGTGTRSEKWELVIKPNIDETNMTSNVLLARRRKLNSILIEKVKILHQDFLKTLDSSLKIAHTKIVRWHPQFNIEGVPDVEVSALPECPYEEKFTTGSEVLEKARQMFNCNTRMEKALERLKKAQGTSQAPKEVVIDNPLLKGIPKALLEKVRQKQAAKALDAITRSSAQDAEAELYGHLPEIARVTQSLYVTERKAVLPLNLVLDKLCNSYRVFTRRSEMETYLRTMSKAVPEWMVFHEIRGSVFIKIVKNIDMAMITNKLTSIAESKKL